MKNQTYKLMNNDTVVIIGGGPAGCSCAIKLKKLATQKNLDIRIIIFEGKRFEKKSYYNQCLGVLSPPIQKILEEQLKVPFPQEIVQKEINGYYIHSDNNTLKLTGEHEPSYACRRVEFDNYLFQSAKKLGIETFSARVTDMDFSPDGVMVYSESNNIKATVVVGAFGLDDGMAKTFERSTAYRQPQFLSSVVTKIHPGKQSVEEFGNYLHAFLPCCLPHVEFGAITPKGNHLTLNIAGKKVNSYMMDKFLTLPSVRKALPENLDEILPHLYYFKGKFPTLPAKGIIGNRYIMVGDTSGLIRPFKGKGVNSAIITGVNAATALINEGFDKESLKSYLLSCSELTDDIPYGKIIRFLTLYSKKFRLLGSLLEIAKKEPAMKKALFNIVSGQETYKKTWVEVKSFKLFLNVLSAMTSNLFSKRKRS